MEAGHAGARLDEQRLEGRLELVSSEGAAEEGPRRPARRMALAAAWDALLGRLPPDWSDLYAEVELDSTDFLDRGALLLAPTNPARIGARTALRFRAARRAGYGVAAEMARLMTRQFKPDPLLRGLAPLVADRDAGVAGFHLYTFNEVARTERWRREAIRRLEAS